MAHRLSTGDTSYRLFIRTTADWLVLTITPFTQLPVDDARSQLMFRRLLELNREHAELSAMTAPEARSSAGDRAACMPSTPLPGCA